MNYEYIVVAINSKLRKRKLFFVKTSDFYFRDQKINHKFYIEVPNIKDYANIQKAVIDVIKKLPEKKEDTKRILSIYMEDFIQALFFCTFNGIEYTKHGIDYVGMVYGLYKDKYSVCYNPDEVDKRTNKKLNAKISLN